MSKRQATATLANGEMVIVVYDPTSGGDPADSIIQRVREAYPDQQIVEVADGNLVMNRQMRDAIATRSATIDDLQAIAQSFDNFIPEEDADAWQQWIDYAADNPTVAIPDAITTAPAGRGEAFALGAAEGAANVFANTLPGARTGFNVGTNPIMSILSRIPYDALTDVFRRQPEVVAAQEQRGGWNTAGRVTGEVVTSAPFVAAGGSGLGLLGRAGTRVAGAPRSLRTAARILQNIGQATTTSGAGVRAVTPAAVRSGAPVAPTLRGRAALRATGGGLSGVGGGLLTDSDDLLLDSLIGGTIPFGATLVRRGAGATYDLIAGRFGDVRAAEIMRNLIAENATEIMAALREAPANARANVAEFLAERNLLTPEIAAASGIAAASSAGGDLTRIARARALDQEQRLNQLRGGSSELEAQQNINAMRQAVRTETDPQRAEALFQADIGRRQILPAEGEAARLGDAAAEEARRAARFYRAADEQSMVLGQMDDLGDTFDPQAINRQRGVIGGLESRGLGFGQRSVDLGAEARSQQEIADNLRAQGLSPLDITGVVGRLRSAARDVQFVNTPRERVLSTFADNLMNRARMMGGVIDAQGLYELRKGMNDEIATLLQGLDPTALQRRTAEIVGEIKPLIDDAIEAAGGTGWRDYLNRFSAGMERVERQTFAKELAKLGNVDPTVGGNRSRFEAIMRGEDTDFLTKSLGQGNYDINAALFGSQLPIANRLARDFGIDRDVASLTLRGLPTETRGPASAGTRARVQEMFEPGQKNWLARAFSRGTGAGTIPGGGAIGDTAAREVSQNIYEATLRSLVPALASPAAALRLMPTRSVNAMTAGAFDSLSPTAQAYVSQSLQQMMNPPAPASVLPSEGDVPPPGQVFLGFQIGPDGQQYPIYGPAGGR